MLDTLAALGADAPHVLGFLVVAIVAVAAPAASIDGDRAPAHIAATRIAAADALPIVTSFASNKNPVSVCHRCLATSAARRLSGLFSASSEVPPSTLGSGNSFYYALRHEPVFGTLVCTGSIGLGVAVLSSSPLLFPLSSHQRTARRASPPVRRWPFRLSIL
jgi:hypothetical protein